MSCKEGEFHIKPSLASTIYSDLYGSNIPSLRSWKDTYIGFYTPIEPPEKKQHQTTPQRLRMITVTGKGHATSSGGSNNGDCITSFIDKGSVESYRYYLCRRTIFEMLSDRGYNVPDSELTRTVAEFRSNFGEKPDLESLRVCISLCSEPYKKVLVIFFGTDEIRKATIQHIYGQIMKKENLHRLILIVQSKMNSFARKELANCPLKVDIFHIDDLLVNITKHVLQPKHEILNAEEQKMLLLKYKLEDKQLPYMLETDAIARYYALEKGQVVKITYKDGIVGSLETYRCVV
ncbi:putative DNA-directed RNA polymerase II [Quillaja saponaria]|uniref:DNA-directed RNA polymerase II n=1 Tax=Quillaja saponaria TaxID=32244 RepID=A0AAD7PC37_QUISA|nr:putative DNA-directed RNA polymerase II [Quillaja saponaria]